MIYMIDKMGYKILKIKRQNYRLKFKIYLTLMGADFHGYFSLKNAQKDTKILGRIILVA